MRTLRLVAGSIVVYAIVACGSAAVQPMLGGTTDASTPSPDDAAGLIGAMTDALANPVPEAAAQTLAPIMATEACNKTATLVTTSVVVAYAEHAFPGRTATQLASVTALATLGATQDFPNYTQALALPFVRDGYVAVECGTPSNMTYTSVTFILPQ